VYVYPTVHPPEYSDSGEGRKEVKKAWREKPSDLMRNSSRFQWEP